jgi:hypothetical protein
MPAPDAVLKLWETFADHREHFRSGNYNKFQLRKQFLDPFFEALGWDMANSQGLWYWNLSTLAGMMKSLGTASVQNGDNNFLYRVFDACGCFRLTLRTVQGRFQHERSRVGNAITTGRETATHGSAVG